MKMQYSSLFAVLSLCACSGSIDVGPGSGGAGGPSGGASGGDGMAGASTSAGGPGSAGGPISTGGDAPACTDETPLPAWPSTSSCAATSDLPLAGTWHGYIENQGAPWDDLTLVIAGASVSGGLCGTLTTGTGTPPAPATDPDAGYPDASGTQFKPHVASKFFAGFVHTLVGGTTDGTRVRFGVEATEPFKGWCALQTSFEGANGTACGCLPNWGFHQVGGTDTCFLMDPATGEDTGSGVDCNKADLCQALGSVCACNSTGCTAQIGPSNSFDLHFTGDTAEGADTAHSNVRVHFTRVP